MEKHYKVYDKHVALWGSPLGNFHKCKFSYKNFTWSSAEQAYQAEKAMYFDDYSAFYKILSTDSPKEAKEIGQTVRGFDKVLWNKVSQSFMYDIVYQKFAQNEDLTNLILSDEFKGKHFVEGSPVDGIWGVRVAWDNPRIDDESNWDGENRLGKVLDDVRNELIEYIILLT